MPVAHGLGKGIGNASTHPYHGGFLDPELFGDHVRCAEPDAANVTCQLIRVLTHDLHRVGAIGLEDAHGPGGSNAMPMQKDHYLTDHLLIGPGQCDLVGPLRPDALDLPQSLRLGFDQIKHVLAEFLDHALGVNRPDATDHAGAKVFLDPLQ